MIQTTPQLNEFVWTMNSCVFQPISTNGSTLSGVFYVAASCEIPTQPTNQITTELKPVEKTPQLGAISIAESIKKHENDPAKAQALARARQKLAAKLSDAPELSLATLRLRCGLSQAKLAEKMGLKQPYIARIESGDDDIKISTITNIAKALNLSETEVLTAFIKTREHRNQNEQIK